MNPFPVSRRLEDLIHRPLTRDPHSPPDVPPRTRPAPQNGEQR